MAKRDEQVESVQKLTLELVKRLFGADNFSQAKTAVMAFIHSMDTEAHILGDGDMESILFMYRQRRGKEQAAKAGK